MLIPFRSRPGGPDRASEEAHLERVIQDIQACRIRARALAFEISELARQFVEDDLRIRSGPEQGNDLTPAGRRSRMRRLGRFHREYWRNRDRETRLMAILTNLEDARAEEGDSWNELEDTDPDEARPGGSPNEFERED